MKQNRTLKRIGCTVGILLIFLIALFSANFIFGDTIHSVQAAGDSVVYNDYWSEATAFDKLTTNVFTYSTETGRQEVNVVSSAAHGSRSNPYVINTPQQWAYFANVISNSAAGYCETDKYFAINQDLDFSGHYVAPINNFQGTLYGQSHIFKNAYIKQNSVSTTYNKYVGLFGTVTNSYISDISMAESCNLYDDGTLTTMGGISAYSDGATFVNCTVNYSMSMIRNGAETWACCIGGISGTSFNCTFAKCTMRGDIDCKAQASGVNTDNVNLIGGITGSAERNYVTITDCFVDKVVFNTENGGPNIAGLIGRPKNAATVKITVKNCYIDFTANVIGGQSPDVGCVFGYAGASPCTSHAESVFQNIYMTGGSSQLFATEIESAPFNVADGQITGLYSSAGTISTVGNIAKLIQPLGSDEALFNQARSDLTSTGNWNFYDDGNVNIVGEPASEFNIAYNLNGGTQGSGAVTTYNNLKNTPLPTPTRTGYAFKGWARGSLSGATMTTINAGTSGDLNLFAVWELNAPIVSLPAVAAVSYGQTVTLALSTTPIPNGVTVSYQWYKKVNGADTLLTGKTSNSIGFTNVSDSGSYFCRVTLTDKDGLTSSADSEVRAATINKATPTLTAPTVTDKHYIGQLLSAVSFTAAGEAKNPNNNAVVAGKFTWTDVSTKITADSGNYSVTFTPDDTENYNSQTIDIAVAAEQLTVTFRYTFGEVTETVETVKVDYGSNLAVSAFPNNVPEKAGYTWAYDRTADFNNIVKNEVVTAKYTAKGDTAYKVEHYKEGFDGKFTVAETENLSGATDTNATATAKTYEGFTLDPNAEGFAASGNIAGDGSLVLSLYYTRNEYTLTLRLKGGAGTQSVRALYGAEVEKPADPVRNGYAFAGFYKDEAFTEQWFFKGQSGADKLLQDTTVYAKWVAADYIITYVVNRTVDGSPEVDENLFAVTAAEGNPESYRVNSAPIVFKNPTAEGHTFLGWYLVGTDTKINQINTGSYGDTELEARWAPASYIVRFDADGGKASASSIIVQNLATFEKLPTATKAGAKFAGWYMDKNGAGIRVNEGDRAILKEELTLYANWEDVEYTVAFEDAKGNELTVTRNGEPFEYGVEKVTTGDVLKFTVKPAAGYSVVRLSVDGKPASNGGNFIVKSGYADDKIVVAPTLRLVTYTITYYLNGGTQGVPPEGTTWTTTYNVESGRIPLPPLADFDGENLVDNPNCPTKAGYYFDGWYFGNDENSESAGYDFLEEGITGNLSLYARWGAMPQEIVFKGNYGGASADELQIANTGETVTLIACSFAGKGDRLDFKFLGWSTTPNGAVEYEDGAQYVVKAGKNVLYAIWHVANMQFVEIKVLNDKMVYGSNPDGIVLTPYPGYDYVSQSVKLYYQWYRLDTNGVYVKYGDEIEMLASESGGNSVDGTNKASIRIKTVAESGNFKCLLRAEGNTELDATDDSGNKINMVTTAEGEGTRSVTMEKAVYDEISFADQTFEYDGNKHSIFIGQETLPEGITVSYTGNGAVKAGSYEVVAVFSVSDTANYKPIESMKANLLITQRKITSINFVGALKDAPDLFSYTYSGNPYVIGAVLSDILDGDDVRAVLEDNSFAPAGIYTAIVTGIAGSDADNYVLDPSLTSVTRNFTINKANYDVSGLQFNGKTVTFNGLKNAIYVTGGLPSGVSVEYNMVYTPFSSIPGVNGLGNGGVNAGTYAITATFKGDADNYNEIPSMRATLVIGKGDFKLDYGEFRNNTVSYAVGVAHNPSIDFAGQGLEERVAAEYSYFKMNNGVFEAIEPGDGLSESGVYKISASLRFLKDEDYNNYKAIETKTVLFNITNLEIKDLKVETYIAGEYKVGQSFDPTDVTVTVYYTDNTQETLDASRYTIAPAVFTAAGEAVLTVEYLGVTRTFTVEVSKGDYNLADVSIGASFNASYDGTGKLPELDGTLPEGVYAVYFSLDGETETELPEGGAVDAGVYNIVVRFAHNDAQNYNPIALALRTKLTIEKAELGVIFGDGNFVYDGTEHTVSATASGVFAGDEVTLTLSGNAATDAGSYTAVASLDEIYKNYKLPAIGTEKDWSIAAQTVSVSFALPESPYVYTGAEQSVEVTVTGADGAVLSGVKAVVSFGRDVVFKDAGKYTATVTALIAEDGSEVKNYTLNVDDADALTKDFEISPKTVEAVWEVSEEADGEVVWNAYDPDKKQLVFNGAAQNTRLRAGYYDGGVYFKMTTDFGGQTFTNAGSYGIAAQNADANYTVTGCETVVVISPKETKVSFEVDLGGEAGFVSLNDASLVYRKSPFAVAAYYLNTAGQKVELTVSVSQNGADAVFANAGGYDFKAAFINEDENFVLSDETLIGIVIAAKQLTVLWTDPEDLVYDGTDKTVNAALIGVEAGDDVSVTLTDNVFADAGVYTAAAAIAGDDASNYAIAGKDQTHEFTVEKRALTVAIADVTVAYTGFEPSEDEISSIAYEFTVGIVVSGDLLGLSFEKESGVDVKEGGYRIDGKWTNQNYELTFLGNYGDGSFGLWTIEQAVPAVNPVYTGTVHEGKPLKDGLLKISEGDTDGSISFEDVKASTGLTPGVYAFNFKFIPKDRVNYSELTGTIQIEIVKIALESVAVTAAPKTDYLVGQYFDPDGIVVTATFNDKSTEQVQDEVLYFLGDADALTLPLELNHVIIVVSYTRDGVTRTAELAISVTAKEVKGIIVKTEPKIEYVEGQKFDASGMTLEATYQDGSTEIITENWRVDLDGKALETTDESVVVTYGGQSVTIAIIVAKKTVKTIEIISAPEKTDYIEGQKFDPAGLIVKAVLNDGSELELLPDALTCDKTFALGDEFVTISYTYDGKTVSVQQAVTVRAKTLTSIRVEKNPDKTDYCAFESFEARGMIVYAVYDNDTSEPIEDYNILFEGVLEVGVEEIGIEYRGKTASVSVLVKPVACDLAHVRFENKTVSYDGEAHGVAVEGLPDFVKVQYLVAGTLVDTVAIVDVGVYTITAKFTVDNKNYLPIDDMTVTLTVSELKVYGTEELSIDYGGGVYDGQAREIALTGSVLADGKAFALEELGISYEIRAYADGVETTLCDAGKYTVVVAFVHDNAGYAEIVPKTFEATIEKAELTLAAENKTMFVGHELPRFTYTVSGLLGEDTEESLFAGLRVEFGVEIDGTSVGSYPIRAKEIPELRNYAILPKEGTLTVNAVELLKIEIEAAPRKTAYVAGEVFDPDGMVVRAYYNDGSDAVVTDCEYPRESLTVDDKTVVVAYLGKEATVEIEVIPAILTEEITFESLLVVYDGTARLPTAIGLPEGVAAEYLIDGDKDKAAVDAGDYTVTAVFTVEDKNYKIENKVVTLKIMPKTLTVAVENLDSMVANGETHALQLTVTGLLDGDPAELQIVYDRDPVEAGGYTATLIAGNKNYALDRTVISFEIKVGEIVGSLDGSGRADVVVNGGGGFQSDVEILIEEIVDEEARGAASEVVKGALDNLYEIELRSGGNVWQPSDKVIVKLLIADASKRDKKLKVYRFEKDGTATDMNAVRDGDYMTFETEHFSRYAIVAEEEIAGGESGDGNVLTYALIGGGALLLILLLVLLFFLIKRRKRKGPNGGGDEPLKLEGAVKDDPEDFGIIPTLPAGSEIAADGEDAEEETNADVNQTIEDGANDAGEAESAEIIDAEFTEIIRAESDSETTDGDNDPDDDPDNDPDAPNDPDDDPNPSGPSGKGGGVEDGGTYGRGEETESPFQETVSDTPNSDNGTSNEADAQIRNDGRGGAAAPSFISEPNAAAFKKTRRFSQKQTLEYKLNRSDDKIKRYYNEIKNYLLSYRRVKSRFSKRFDTFRLKRLFAARVTVRGKTLKLYLNLDPASIDAKYRVVDVSEIKTFQKTPALLKVRSDRALKYAFALIARFMAENGAETKKNYFDKNFTRDFRNGECADLERLSSERILNDFQKAIEKREICAYYQPKYSISKKKVRGAEALCRWNHRELGFIPPSKFVPVVEERGLVSKLDYYMFEEVCRETGRWKQNGTPVEVSFNVSKRMLIEENFVQNLSDILKRNRREASEFEIEITETLLSEEYDEISNVLAELKKMGFRIAMDDFGSKYSSLNMLGKISHVDEIKLDKAFVTDHAGARDKTILSNIVRMARELNVGVTAEGVEQREQVDFLTECGCDCFQGYYFGRAMPEKTFFRSFIA